MLLGRLFVAGSRNVSRSTNSVSYLRLNQRGALRTCKQLTTAEVNAEAEEAVASTEQSSKNLEQITGFYERVKKQGKTSQHVDSLLKSEDLTEYKPFYDPKYNKNRLTQKSATYMDIIRLGPQPSVDIPLDIHVTDTRAFNLSLLELFQVNEVIQARDYFFLVTKRTDSPADRNSFNIAITEFVNAGEVELAATVFNFLKETEFGPDVISYNAMISACGKYASVAHAQCYLDEMKELGIEPNKKTKEYLIAVYLKRGDIETGKNLVAELGGFENLPAFVPGLFARAYTKEQDYDNMEVYAWSKGTLNNDHCHHIIMELTKRSEFKLVQQFLEKMEENGAKLSWTASETIVDATEDGRNEFKMTPVIEKLLADLTLAPNDNERIQMIREATINEREHDVVFRKRKKRAPIWKRKVEYKNPADTAWDTLIQEYLAIAIKEQKIENAVAKTRRNTMDSTRGADKDYFKKPKIVFKKRKPWKL